MKHLCQAPHRVWCPARLLRAPKMVRGRAAIAWLWERAAVGLLSEVAHSVSVCRMPLYRHSHEPFCQASTCAHKRVRIENE